MYKSAEWNGRRIVDRNFFITWTKISLYETAWKSLLARRIRYYLPRFWKKFTPQNRISWTQGVVLLKGKDDPPQIMEEYINYSRFSV